MLGSRSSSRRGAKLGALAAGLVLAAAACSSDGGASSDGGGGTVAGKADTPRLTVAMVSHAPDGDTFHDIIRRGADAAAAKDNIEYQYAADDEVSQQSVLVQNAIDRKVDAIAMTVPNPEALAPVIQKAVDAGIPVFGFNAGGDSWQDLGLLAYFGQDETVAGQAAGVRLSEDGAQKVLCVVQAQGQVQLEARCDGVTDGFSGTTVKLYVTGTDLPSVRSTIAAKLTEDPSIDHVITLGAPIALAAVQSISESGSSAKLVTFDTNAELVDAIESGDVQWAIDQQPYLQGYSAIDAAWLYLTNGNILGGGEAVLTGPSFIDSTNIDTVAEYARAGTR